MGMAHSRKVVGVLITVSVCLVQCGELALAQGKTKLLLFTPGEAAQLRMGPDDSMPPVTRSIPPGPRIVVREPTVTRTVDGAVIETTPSTRLVIVFEPNRAPVDMDSLDVRARKGPFAVSLTSRLKPYVQGTTLQAEGVTVPEGRFVVQIEIVDRSGAKTVETYRLDVRASGHKS